MIIVMMIIIIICMMMMMILVIERTHTCHEIISFYLCWEEWISSARTGKAERNGKERITIFDLKKFVSDQIYRCFSFFSRHHHHHQQHRSSSQIIDFHNSFYFKAMKRASGKVKSRTNLRRESFFFSKTAANKYRHFKGRNHESYMMYDVYDEN